MLEILYITTCLIPVKQKRCVFSRCAVCLKPQALKTYVLHFLDV